MDEAWFEVDMRVELNSQPDYPTTRLTADGACSLGRDISKGVHVSSSSFYPDDQSGVFIILDIAPWVSKIFGWRGKFQKETVPVWVFLWILKRFSVLYFSHCCYLDIIMSLYCCSHLPINILPFSAMEVRKGSLSVSSSLSKIITGVAGFILKASMPKRR